MSVLMFVNSDEDGSGWPSDDAVNRYRNKSAPVDGRPPVTVITYREAVAAAIPKQWTVDAVAREFERATRHGHEVRLVLTGFQDPRLVERLYRERDVPVNVVFRTPDVNVRWSDAFGSLDGVTLSGWNGPPFADEADVIATVLDVFDVMSEQYRSYVRGLRVMPSAVETSIDDDDDDDDTVTYENVTEEYAGDDDGTCEWIIEAYGDRSLTVELVLDAVLKRLCDDDDRTAAADGDDGRWTWPTVIEEGDRAAEDACRLMWTHSLSETAAVDYARRTTRVATSFALSFWRHAGDRPTASDRTLTACLVDNVRAAAGPEFDHMSDEHFAMCLNAKFIAGRRWWPTPPVSTVASSLFRTEIRKPCELFLAVDHLTDLMGDTDDGGGGDGVGVGDVFGKSHVEHLEPYVLPQRLVEYAERYQRYEVRYFKITDSLVFRFTDGERGEMVERNHHHRLAGPRNFKEFHGEVFRIMESTKNGNGGDGIPGSLVLPVDDYPNTLVYRDVGYTDVKDHGVHYVSANGETKVRTEVYTFHEDGDANAACEQRHRTVVECGRFWVSVHGLFVGGGSSLIELTVGLVDGTVVAVTRKDDGGFLVNTRRPDGRSTDDDLWLYNVTWPDGLPIFEFYFGTTVDVNAADGTRVAVDYERPSCEVHVSDGTKIRTRTDPVAIDVCPAVADRGRAPNDKYLVCRRDLSGYEFSDGPPDRTGDPQNVGPTNQRRVAEGSPAVVVRTLTRSPFDGRTAGLVDGALSDHFKAVKTVAERMNAEYPDDEIAAERSDADLLENDEVEIEPEYFTTAPP